MLKRGLESRDSRDAGDGKEGGHEDKMPRRREPQMGRRAGGSAGLDSRWEMVPSAERMGAFGARILPTEPDSGRGGYTA